MAIKCIISINICDSLLPVSLWLEAEYAAEVPTAVKPGDTNWNLSCYNHSVDNPPLSECLPLRCCNVHNPPDEPYSQRHDSMLHQVLYVFPEGKTTQKHRSVTLSLVMIHTVVCSMWCFTWKESLTFLQVWMHQCVWCCGAAQVKMYLYIFHFLCLAECTCIARKSLLCQGL
jgi:hypothetical protein